MYARTVLCYTEAQSRGYYIDVYTYLTGLWVVCSLGTDSFRGQTLLQSSTQVYTFQAWACDNTIKYKHGRAGPLATLTTNLLLFPSFKPFGTARNCSHLPQQMFSAEQMNWDDRLVGSWPTR